MRGLTTIPSPSRADLHFSPPDGRSTRYDRQDFVAFACRAQRTVQVRLRAPSGSRLVLAALSRTSPRHVVRNAGWQPMGKVTQAALRASGPIAYCPGASGRRHLALRAAKRKRRVTLWATDICGRRVCRSSEEIHPDRHPPHSAPNDRRSPPRLPRDFYHGLLRHGERPCFVSRVSLCGKRKGRSTGRRRDAAFRAM